MYVCAQELEQRVYDIILMDVHMPIIDGLEASRRIRDTYPADERPKIVALSADTTQVRSPSPGNAGSCALLSASVSDPSLPHPSFESTADITSGYWAQHPTVCHLQGAHA